MLNPTESCNLSCSYCYISDKKVKRLSYENLERIFSQLFEIEKESLNVLIIGGEPLAFGLAGLQDIVSIEKKYNYKNIPVSNSLQSNGTLITEGIAQFFHDEHFNVGISFDGPKWLHDKNRVLNNREGSYDSVIQGINHLKNEDVPFSTLTVLTHDSLGYERDIIDSIRGVGSKRARLSVYTPSNGSNDSFFVTPKELGESWIRFYDYWMETGDIVLEPFESIVRSFLLGYNDGCAYSAVCESAFVAVDSFLDVYSCNRFVGLKDFSFGNIFDTSLSDLLSKKAGSTLMGSEVRRAYCDSCKFVSICNGGCASETLGVSGSVNTHYPFCQSRKMLFEHVKNSIENMIL